MMATPKITTSELLLAMEEARSMAQKGIKAERPKGYFTALEYSQLHKISRYAAVAELQKLVRQGSAKTDVAHCQSVLGYSRRQTVYGLVKEKGPVKEKGSVKKKGKK